MTITTLRSTSDGVRERKTFKTEAGLERYLAKWCGPHERLDYGGGRQSVTDAYGIQRIQIAYR